MNLSTTKGFPRPLLEQPAEERERYFVNKIIAHPHLIEALAQAMLPIKHPAKGQLVLIFGPTGAGKTTLCRRIERQILEEAHEAMLADPGHVPVGSMELLTSGKTGYSWKAHYTNMLRALNEPESLLTHKLDPNRTLKRDTSGRVIVDRNSTLDALEYAVEMCIKYRRTRAFLMDEAHHIAEHVVGHKKMLAEMSSVKSMANRTGLVPVLFGTYELLPVLDLSDQVIRRPAKIHLARYHLDSPKDRQGFLGVIHTLQQHLPLADEPDLLDEYQYLYEGSLGVVGLLKEWLDRALIQNLYAGRDGETKFTYADCLRMTALSDTELIEILETINYGESAVASRTQRRGDLRARLAVHTDHETSTKPTISHTASAELPGKRNKRQRPGTRKPARDAVVQYREAHGVANPTP